MSRPRQTKESREAEAKAAFRTEVKIRQLQLDMTQADIAQAADMDRSVLSRSLMEPDKLSVGRLRKIIQAMDLSPVIILGLLGYDRKVTGKLEGEGA